jgi:aldose 1-epimerase
MSVKECNLGEKNGTEIKSYTMTNANNVEVEIINIGCAVTRFMVPDSSGKQVNIVLGYPKWEDYITNGAYFGVVVGRVAGRIDKGKFSLDGKEYQLTVNNPPNSLHGGEEGFSHKIWEPAGASSDNSQSSVVFKYRSADGEEGYPGTMDVTVEYILNNDNELILNYSAECDKKSIVNLTNHTYFNLHGRGTVLDHDVTIRSEKILLSNKDLIPTGEEMAVDGTPFDFREPRRVGQSIADDNPQLKIAKGYDHAFILENNGKLENCARVADKESGITLEVDTDAPAVLFYTGNFLDGVKGNEEYVDNAGLCLETQNMPDAVNHPNFPSSVIEPGTEWKTTTVFRV